jgi:hypothetical protein
MERGLDHEERGGEHDAEFVKSRTGVPCLWQKLGWSIGLAWRECCR